MNRQCFALNWGEFLESGESRSALYQGSASAEPWSFYIFPAICFDSITPSGDPPTRIKSVYIEFY